MEKVIIAGREISARRPPLIVAEMSGNHNQSLDRALLIVDEAARCGCDAIKLQTYTPDTLTINCKRKEFLIKNKDSLWNGSYLYDLYKIAYTPWEWHKAIFRRCHKAGLIAFSTPFDETAVDFLQSLDVPAYKISSFENTHLPLIRKVAKTKKPIIISTGMATIRELQETVRTARAAGCKNIILLKCTSAYPSIPREANILTIPHLAKRFRCLVGLSDHTAGIGVSVASIALGARVIEKHFTLSRKEGGVDSAFSLEPAEMRDLVEQCRKSYSALGKIHYGLSASEKKSIRFRCSVFAVQTIPANEKFTADNIRIIRPGDGLAPKYYSRILGKRSSRNISRGTPITWALIKK